MKQIYGMYFSGTGTTEKTVTTIANEAAQNPAIKAETIDFTPPLAREKKYKFKRDEVVFIGVPVIAGRVPNVLLKFMDTLEGGDALAIPIVLYGNRNFDDALIELRDILEKKGFHTIAGAAFIGEHSFSRILAAGRPDEEDLQIAKAFAREVTAKIRRIENKYDANDEGSKFPKPIEVDGETPLRDYYKPQDRKGKHINILKVKPKLDAGKCTGCGICVKACPMGSIKAEAPGTVEGICIKCCGCEKKCPEGALYFDDPGYLYHKEELEFLYADKRREPALFI